MAGNGATVLKVVPQCAIQMSVYDGMKDLLLRHSGGREELRNLQRLTAGGAARQRRSCRPLEGSRLKDPSRTAQPFLIRVKKSDFEAEEGYDNACRGRADDHLDSNARHRPCVWLPLGKQDRGKQLDSSSLS